MDKIDKILKNVDLKEGRTVIEKFLLNLYFYERLSTKELAQMLVIPIPLVTAIKKEAIKENLVKQHNGIVLSEEGDDYVNNYMGYGGVNKKLYRKILDDVDDSELNDFYNEIYETMEAIFKNRVEVDVTIDQSKCTVDTAIKRVIMGLKRYSIIGKNIACIGDDDLISVTINIILKELYKGKISKTIIYVIEKDTRIIDYIKRISEIFELNNIVTIEIDLKEKMTQKMKNIMDCVYTDTPYTYNGLKLFLSRAVEILKKETGLNIFLSFEHKSQDDMLKIEVLFYNMGLSISEVFLRFNEYEAAKILGGERTIYSFKNNQ